MKPVWYTGFEVEVGIPRRSSACEAGNPAWGKPAAPTPGAALQFDGTEAEPAERRASRRGVGERPLSIEFLPNPGEAIGSYFQRLTKHVEHTFACKPYLMGGYLTEREKWSFLDEKHGRALADRTMLRGADELVTRNGARRNSAAPRDPTGRYAVLSLHDWEFEGVPLAMVMASS